MTTVTPKKIAILGGGISALTTAFELTNQPDSQSKYDITLFKDGFQTRTIKQEVSTPWYQYAPLDLLSENVWPLQITDIRPLCYDLEPYAQPNLDQIKADAEELRRRGLALPPPRFPGLEDKPRPAPAPRPGEPPPLPAPRDLNDLPPLLPPPGF